MALSDPVSELRPVGVYPSLGAYLRNTWSRRVFILRLAQSRIKAGQAHTYLGRLWLFIEPAVFIAIFTLFIGFGLRGDRGVDGFVSFLAIGQAIFSHSSRAIQDGSTATITHRGLMESLSFPRFSLVIADVLGSMIALGPGLLVAVGAMLIDGHFPAWRWLVFVPVLILQIVFNVGTASIAARLGSMYPDFPAALAQVFRFLMFASMVLFTPDMFLGRGRVGDLILEILIYNPLYCLIYLARWSLTGIELIDPGEMVISALVWSFGTFLLGIIWFYKGEHTYGPVARQRHGS